MWFWNMQDLSDLHLKDRLQAIERRVRDNFGERLTNERTQRKLQRSNGHAYQWAHWSSDEVVKAGFFTNSERIKSRCTLIPMMLCCCSPCLAWRALLQPSSMGLQAASWDQRMFQTVRAH